MLGLRVFGVRLPCQFDRLGGRVSVRTPDTGCPRDDRRKCVSQFVVVDCHCISTIHPALRTETPKPDVSIEQTTIPNGLIRETQGSETYPHPTCSQQAQLGAHRQRKRSSCLAPPKLSLKVKSNEM